MTLGFRTLYLLSMILASTAILELVVVTARELPAGPSKNDKMQPQWLLDPDGSLIIPGIGRVIVPTKYRPYLHNIPNYGDGGRSINTPIGGVGGGYGGGTVMSPPSRRGYIPGGDDTFVPNPGVEVPNPVQGSTPAPSRP
ncbi:hypothetical protein SAY87_030431 [Trapa incisa]|uniref:Cell wall protein n=1 Tax=Trapa incisa TaxID=236973 RepID=A0AAN7KNY1_9MYRT|nr:hypothetical protein SAY87_030431 [Trapa incisa]